MSQAKNFEVLPVCGVFEIYVPTLDGNLIKNKEFLAYMRDKGPPTIQNIRKTSTVHVEFTVVAYARSLQEMQRDIDVFRNLVMRYVESS